MTVQNDKELDIALGKYKVYKHTGPTGKVYIGITRDSLQRRWKGGHGYVTNTHFFRAIQRYGWAAFQHKVLFEGLTEVEAIAKEQELIALYDSTNPVKGYNRDPGGGVRSAQTTAKISAALTGVPLSPERRQRMSESRKGKKLSEECKRKLGESLRNSPSAQAHLQKLHNTYSRLPKSPEHRRKIAESQPRRKAVINLDTGEVFPSVNDAAKSCNGSHPNITKVCTGERTKAFGYRWAYKEVQDRCS